jgi:signal transduction histidine kinase/predicted small secreted protein
MVNAIKPWIQRTRLTGARYVPADVHRAVTRRLAFWLFCCLLLAGCNTLQTATPGAGPAIVFTGVPVARRGDAAEMSTISGRVIGGRAGQQIVLYARALDDYGQMTWFVQPFVFEPVTRIHSNSKWSNSTHPGFEYAALLVSPGFQAPSTTHVLPTEGVLGVATSQGWPPMWQRWWFPLICVALAAGLTFALYRVWVFEMTRKLHLRFEERLAERTRVAQELHDTLLQGVLSASMQLHVAVDQLPEHSPTRPALNRVLQLMGQVIEEGRNTLRGLRSPADSPHDLQSSFARIPQELGTQSGIDFRVVVEGQPLQLRSIIRDDVYGIGREALVNAFRHSRAQSIAMQLEYTASHLGILVRDDGCGIDPQVLKSGRDGHFGVSGMRERAERIGANLKLLSRIGGGTEVELRVPGEIAFESRRSVSVSKWSARWYRRRGVEHISEKRVG